MIQYIGSLGANARGVSEDGGKSELDGFLAKLLGAFFDAFVQEPGGVGGFGRSRAPFGDTADQVSQYFKVIAGHFSAIQWSLTGIPCAARYRLAWLMEISPKWKTEAASTAAA